MYLKNFQLFFLVSCVWATEWTEGQDTEEKLSLKDTSPHSICSRMPFSSNKQLFFFLHLQLLFPWPKVSSWKSKHSFNSVVFLHSDLVMTGGSSKQKPHVLMMLQHTVRKRQHITMKTVNKEKYFTLKTGRHIHFSNYILIYHHSLLRSRPPPPSASPPPSVYVCPCAPVPKNLCNLLSCSRELTYCYYWSLAVKSTQKPGYWWQSGLRRQHVLITHTQTDTQTH